MTLVQHPEDCLRQVRDYVVALEKQVSSDQPFYGTFCLLKQKVEELFQNKECFNCRQRIDALEAEVQKLKSLVGDYEKLRFEMSFKETIKKKQFLYRVCRDMKFFPEYSNFESVYEFIKAIKLLSENNVYPDIQEKDQWDWILLETTKWVKKNYNMELDAFMYVILLCEQRNLSVHENVLPLSEQMVHQFVEDKYQKIIVSEFLQK
jgi:hypothetical protein